MDKKVISLLLTAALCMTAVVLPHTSSTGTRVYAASGTAAISTDGMEIENGVLVKYTGSQEHVVIPSSVKTIGENAFQWCNEIKSVTIPSSVTSIGNSAFYGCTSMESVTIPSSVKSIGDFAFYYCAGLRELTLPDSVTSVGSSAFSECTELRSIRLPGRLSRLSPWVLSGCNELTTVTIPSSVTVIDDSTFYGCNSLTKVTIPSSVKSMGSGIFAECRSLKQITLPSSVTAIPSSAFSGCTSLQDIGISASVTSIGDRAFQNCDALTEFTVPSTVKSMGTYVFAYCHSLQKVTLPAGVTSLEGMFTECTSLETFTVPSSVTDISRAFEDCTKLKSVRLPQLKEIGEGAFSHCRSLNDITVPSSVRTIGGGAFDGCSSLTSLTLPQGITVIPSKCFADTALQSLALPSTVTDIGSYAFAGSNQLQSVTLPSSVRSIGNYAFSSCGKLKTVTIPSSLTTVGAYTFSGCASLTQVTLPAGITRVEEAAFADCSSLKKVAMSDKVTFIGDGAFFNCRSLTDVTLSAQLKTLGADAFMSCVNLPRLTLPASVTTIGEGAFCNCSKLTTLTVPSGVTKLNDSTFHSCYQLTTVRIPASVTQLADGLFYRCSSLSDVYYGGTKAQWEKMANAVNKNGCSIDLNNKATVNCKDGVIAQPFKILSDTRDQSTVVGSIASFSAYVSGSHLTYQWYGKQNGASGFTRLDGETEGDLMFTVKGSDNLSQYYCVITDGSGQTLTTNTAKLTVLPKIVQQPEAWSYAAKGERLTVSVKATGAGLTYQWQLSDNNCSTWYNSTVKKDTYTVTVADNNDGRYLRCVITDANGRTLTTKATVIKMTSLALTQQPVDASAGKGGRVTFSVKATGEELSYQWQLSDDGGKKWYNSTVQKDTYTATLGDNNNGRLVRCIVTDRFGAKVTSSAAAMRFAPLYFVTQPVNVSGAVNDKATFSVKAAGTGLSYQWYYRKTGDSAWTKWKNATGSSASLTVYNSWNGTQCYCIVKDADGNTVQSHTVKLLVVPKITAQPVRASGAVNDKVTFSVKATGNGKLTYQWYYKKAGDSSWTKWKSATGSSASLTVYKSWNGAQFYCAVSDTNQNTVKTNTVKLTVTQ